MPTISKNKEGDATGKSQNWREIVESKLLNVCKKEKDKYF